MRITDTDGKPAGAGRMRIKTTEGTPAGVARASLPTYLLSNTNSTYSLEINPEQYLWKSSGLTARVRLRHRANIDVTPADLAHDQGGAADWLAQAMEALRQNSQHGKVGSSSNTPVQTQQGQGLAALLVMIAVLCFIVAYCCWGAPCCRAFCRRRCCCHLGGGARDVEASPSDVGLSVDRGMVATPTIILLPYGRMLVVDGSVFAQLQADTSGLDLIELGENVVRAQQSTQSHTGSTPSILEVDSETASKDGCISPMLGGLPPPTYESIFGSQNIGDLPPSYEEILRQLQQSGGNLDDYIPGEIRESRV